MPRFTAVYSRLLLCILVPVLVLIQFGVAKGQPPHPTDDSPADAPPVRLANAGTLSREGKAPVGPPEKTDSVFVADTGGNLDDYFFREDVPNGRLSFSIPIGRYYSPFITPDKLYSNGLLKPEVAGILVDKGILPANATLTLQVFDVDHEQSDCPEVDHIYINGQQLFDPRGRPAVLTSGNDTWSTWSISVPIGNLKFPAEKGSNANPPTKAQNIVEIDINTEQCDRPDGTPGSRWAVEVDWGAITIENRVRPIVFVHGWTGSESTLQKFYEFTGTDYIPAYRPMNLNDGIEPIATTAYLLKPHMVTATIEFGVDKVNLFAHSKGGQVARYLLRVDPSAARLVDRLITFGSPHHGTDMPNLLTGRNCKYSTDAENAKCREAADELSVSRIRDEFNYEGCTKRFWWSDWEGCRARWIKRSDVTYASIVGWLGDIKGTEATFPWDADAIPFPKSTRVAAQFNLENHNSIKETRGPYGCAMRLIQPRLAIAGSCPGATAGIAGALEDAQPLWPDESYQMAFTGEGSGPALYDVIVDSSQQALFTVVSDTPIVLTLSRPDGTTVGPDTADASITYVAGPEASFGRGYIQQYQISTPQVGIWRMTVGGSTPLNYLAFVALQSPMRLGYRLDRPLYAPGALVTLEAAVGVGENAAQGVTMSGAIEVGGTQVPLVFRDDGTAGDRVVSDGIVTAQFNAPAQNGLYPFTLRGTGPGISREARGTLAVMAQSGQLRGLQRVTTADRNANGLFDTLTVFLTVNVLEAADFELAATLKDVDGNSITTAVFSTKANGGGPLQPGLHTLALEFDGQVIRQHGRDGRLYLGDVVLRDLRVAALKVDEAPAGFTLGSYRAAQFEGPLLAVASATAIPTDSDGNGKYNLLDIALRLDVQRPGIYSWNGRLVDSSGNEIGWAVGQGFIDSATPAVFTFEGERIGASGRDGPYTLQDVSIYQTDGPINALIGKAYVTPPYSYLSFEGATAKTYLPAVRR